MVNMDEIAKVGCRIECDGTKGTIKWIGDIPSFEGLWLGIDWDDEQRGKHDGSHKGIRYFTTQFEKSGSFVRPGKVNFGMTLEEAVRGRYQDDYTIKEELTSQLKRNINARFVEVVGMEKIGKQQSQLSRLRTVVLDGWLVRNGGSSNLGALLPCVQSLDISNSLVSSWEDVAYITGELPLLSFLNVSGNLLHLPANPLELVKSTQHLTHVVMHRMLTYTWEDIVFSAAMFPKLRKFQIAFNNLEKLGPIPSGVLEMLEDLDIGVNPIEDWTQICHLGNLPRLEHLNLNSCKLKAVEFPETPPQEKTKLFSALKSLTIANNPLNSWDCVGELNKLENLQELVLSNEEVNGQGNHFLEYTFARIQNLKMLNRTMVTPREKKDHQIFYLHSFSNEYYSNGGTDDPDQANLTPEFWRKHPSYLAIAKLHGAPTDERNHESRKSQKLRDLKIYLTIIPDNPGFEQCVKSFLPATRVSKLKMMIKKWYKLDGSSNVSVIFRPLTDNDIMEFELDNDRQELQFFSMKSGDALRVHW